MDWVSFGAGSILTLFAYFLFTADKNEEDIDENEEGIEVNGIKPRRVEMSCQTCRKLKWHKEIEQYLFECMKCKRRVDLRKAS